MTIRLLFLTIEVLETLDILGALIRAWSLLRAILSNAELHVISTSGMAEDAIALLDHLGWTGQRELNVVGISLGGMIAQGEPSPLLARTQPVLSNHRARL